MRKLALFSVSAALLGNAYALVIGVPPADPFAPPESFRSGVYHHKEPCTKENSHCLANHLMYLQCGAILVEKMALEEGETSEWHAYSMHSGPKVPFAIAGYEILLWFDPSLPANWYSGEEFDPRAVTPGRGVEGEPYSLDRLNISLTQFIQQTLDWLDSREETLADACELRAYWNELRSNSTNPGEESPASGGDRSDMPSDLE